MTTAGASSAAAAAPHPMDRGSSTRSIYKWQVGTLRETQKMWAPKESSDSHRNNIRQFGLALAPTMTNFRALRSPGPVPSRRNASCPLPTSVDSTSEDSSGEQWGSVRRSVWLLLCLDFTPPTSNCNPFGSPLVVIDVAGIEEHTLVVISAGFELCLCTRRPV